MRTGKYLQIAASEELIGAFEPHGYRLNVGNQVIVDVSAMIEVVTDFLTGGIAFEVMKEYKKVQAQVIKSDVDLIWLYQDI